MTLCRLPLPLLVAYLATQIALVFAVTMTTDMATRGYYRYGGDIAPKVFIHLFSMTTIVRCFILLGKACIPAHATEAIRRPDYELAHSRCPYKRVVQRYLSALLHELFFIAMWITIVVLAFVISNVPAGIISIIVLFFQILQGLSVVAEVIHKHLKDGKEAGDSLYNVSVHSMAGTPPTNAGQETREHEGRTTMGSMFMSASQDDVAVDAEKGYRPGERGASQRYVPVDARVHDFDQENRPRLSEDTVCMDGDSATENDNLLK